METAEVIAVLSDAQIEYGLGNTAEGHALLAGLCKRLAAAGGACRVTPAPPLLSATVTAPAGSAVTITLHIYSRRSYLT
jgi:hypothetical protein